MFEAVLLTVITAATPLLIAAIGELVAERSGVLNLGVEGMMIMGAVVGFAVANQTGSGSMGIIAAICAGMAMAALFGFLVLFMVANQVATGLALTILGIGFSGLIGEAYIGVPGLKLPKLDIPVLSDIPFIGPVLFQQDVIVYLSFALVAVVAYMLFRTRSGLILRAVGNNHGSAHALGYSVIKIRFLAVLFGGACAGLAGAYMSLAYTPQWVENMTAGRGWIALALVVFSSWLPLRVVVGAYLFGAVSVLNLHAQAIELNIPSQLLSSLPYLATILVLVLISANRRLTLVNTPACLGKPFVPDR
ncbi:ABC transporter permease [Roseibium salinum]|uniref:ABC transporter permease n=1 Tax=Roseibium salinum TaxID=1604349 RepID=A0ABT3R0Q2_9HYPH|nr:ABC transporter permease [Roseibium sp. DSM 29163]MCX2722701.1 ABC transporter permease [Roseibium sp. DSM 29163]MDN3719351.1 ABC transporter permease [Roseibium salinum]